PSRPPGRTISHAPRRLRGDPPAKRRPLRGQPRRAALRNPQAAGPLRPRRLGAGLPRVHGRPDAASQRAIIVDANRWIPPGPEGEPHVTDQLPPDLATWPAWTPDEEQLGELE